MTKAAGSAEDLPLAVVLLVAIFTVHIPSGGPLFAQPGSETDLLYLSGLVALVLGSPGHGLCTSGLGDPSADLLKQFADRIAQLCIGLINPHDLSPGA